MNAPRYSQLAARLLRAARGRIGPRPSTPPADAVARLGGVIRGAAARRRSRRIVRSIATVAGAAGIVLGLGWMLTHSRETKVIGSMAGLPAHPSFPNLPNLPNLPVPSALAPLPRPTFVVEGTAVATVAAPGGPVRPLLSGQEWRFGERLQTDVGAVALATRDGSSIEVEPHSDLRLVRADAERWLRLGSGAVEVRVAKLKAAERFVITTPDAEVEVRGTRFRVAIVPAVEDCGLSTVTRVSVTEGVVVVRAFAEESRVEAGNHWPSDCVERPVSVVASPGGELHAAARRQAAATPREPAVRQTPSADLSLSTLATENDLFGAALKAESAGDRREAVQLLDVLLARFPASPLRESALVERARLVGSTHPPPRP